MQMVCTSQTCTYACKHRFPNRANADADQHLWPELEVHGFCFVMTFYEQSCFLYGMYQSRVGQISLYHQGRSEHECDTIFSCLSCSCINKRKRAPIFGRCPNNVLPSHSLYLFLFFCCQTPETPEAPRAPFIPHAHTPHHSQTPHTHH